MKTKKTFTAAVPMLSLLALALATGQAQAQASLEGWAIMPANTFSPGPTTGQFANGAGGNPLPLVGLQSVQGFSGVLPGPVAGSYRFMTDNGFGTQGNSADALLRTYALMPDFRTATGGSGTVSAMNYTTGAALSGFSAQSSISLADPDHKLGFAIQAD